MIALHTRDSPEKDSETLNIGSKFNKKLPNDVLKVLDHLESRFSSSKKLELETSSWKPQKYIDGENK